MMCSLSLFVIFNYLYLYSLRPLSCQKMVLLQVLVQLFQSVAPVIHPRYNPLQLEHQLPIHQMLSDQQLIHQAFP